MQLKELSIAGFKSFAKKGDLSFLTPITAIVGPNGSGKSNVAEAFRFVLGEQSVKSMRGKRGEDLIWGGSDAVARSNRASVRVVFDNRDRLLALDFDEVSLERVVHRDGQNEYKINGSAVRLKDIHELLAGAHIGATGHHIISQGEADRVISAGAKERREMIEDALGLKVFQLKKQEAERKLARTQDNIAQTESLRREAAPHVRYLKKQVERAERSLQTQAALEVAYREYLKREEVYLARQAAQLKASTSQPATELAAVTERISQLRQRLEAVSDRMDDTALTESETQLAHTQAALREAERASSTLLGQVSFLERRLAAAQQQAASAPTQVAIGRLQAEQMAALLQQVIEALQTGTDLRPFVTQLEAAHTTFSELVQDGAPAVATSVVADTQELAALQAQVRHAQHVTAEAQQAEASAQQQVRAARAALQGKSEQQQADERSLFEQLNQERELRQTLATLESQTEQLSYDQARFKQELQEAVVLVGRAVAGYRQHVVTHNGATVPDTHIHAEPREQQQERQRQLEKLKIRLEELGVGDTRDLLKEYEDAQARDAFLASELADLTQSVGNLESLIADMDAQLQAQFTAGIEKISTEFDRFFTLMFGGGSAQLQSVVLPTKDDASVDEQTKPAARMVGVDLSVSLPNKRVKGLQMLSGGERALTSIALIFAMSQVNPPPFIILDETDAALDEANSRRYGDMIEALAQKSQLILITHNRETMSRAGVLYGVTMAGDGVSKLLSVKFDEASVHAK